MDPKKKTARLAGLLYLIVVLTGLFHLMYVPSKLIDWEDPAATLHNITSSEMLFRLGILGGIVCYTAFLFLPFALYKLLTGVYKIQGTLMITLVVVSVAISFVNLLNKFAVLTLLKHNAPAGDVPYLQNQVMLYLRFYSNGNQIATIFWGLWLLPFGYLVLKSKMLPRLLGILLISGGSLYIIDFLCGFLSAPYNETDISSFLSIPGSLGEIGTCLWLLVFGVKMPAAKKEPETAFTGQQ